MKNEHASPAAIKTTHHSAERSSRAINDEKGRLRMAARDDGAGLGAARVLDGDEVQGVLTGAFYQPQASGGGVSAPPESERKVGKDAKPTHYKVICISMYTKDLGRLDELVEELKARGITKANRSALIRVALEQLDLDKVPRGL